MTAWATTATTTIPTTVRQEAVVAADTDDDADLAARFARGGAGAFEQVVALHHPRVARLAHRLLGWAGDSDDVVQDVFLTALASARSFRGRSSLTTWLATITLNRCRRHLRRRALFRRFVASPARAPTAAAAPPADHATIDAEVATQVRAAVNALPPRDREVIVLYYLEHRTVADMSKLLNARPNAVEVRLHRARAKLNAALSKFVNG
jgi:RNA polymerase sigma factor (sigma-70 family)